MTHCGGGLSTGAGVLGVALTQWSRPGGTRAKDIAPRHDRSNAPRPPSRKARRPRGFCRGRDWRGWPEAGRLHGDGVEFGGRSGGLARPKHPEEAAADSRDAERFV